MNLENSMYLKEQVFFRLRRTCRYGQEYESRQGKLFPAVCGTFNKVGKTDSVDYTLNFSKSKTDDFYCLNNYQAQLKNENRNWIGRKLFIWMRVIVLPPGFEVFHIQEIDFKGRCLTLKNYLQELKIWSDQNKDHFQYGLPSMQKMMSAAIPILLFLSNSQAM